MQALINSYLRRVRFMRMIHNRPKRFFLMLLSALVIFGELPAAAQEMRKEQVVIGFQARTSGTNPTSQTSIAHRIFFSLTHDTLVDYDELSGELVPGLAEAWSADETYRIWTFTLREDARFHNGELLTADDVVFTWEWARDNAPNATVRNFYSGHIEQVEAKDDQHVVMTLPDPNVDFAYELSAEYLSVLNREAVSADPEEGPSVGTGPYVNTEYVEGDHTTLTRFEEYWGEQPPTHELLFRYIPDGSTRLAALEAGEIDVCQAPNNTELDIIRANEELELYTYQTTALTALAFNLQDPMLQDPNLRLAIACAINSQEIIDGAASGQGVPAYGMWGDYEYGYFDDWESAGLQAYTPQDMERAREYLSETNWPEGGLQLVFTASSAWTVNALQIIQAQLAPLGIEVVIDQTDAAGFGQKVAAGEHQVAIFSVTFTDAGSDAAKIYTPGNSLNYAAYDNERVQELFRLAAGKTDDAQRQEDYREIQTIVHKDCPYIPLYYANSGVACTRKVTGAVFNRSGKHDYSRIQAEE